MADIFSKKEMENMLKGKHILILGDSNMRALYKDMVWLINKGTLVTAEAIRAKGEISYLGDRRLVFDSLTKGRNYVEHREYYHPSSQTRIEYKFITQVLCQETRDMLEFFKNKPNQAPSVLLINSTCWDLTRWGPKGDKKFRFDLRELLSLLRSNLPCDTVVMWLTALQPAHRIRSTGLIVKQLQCIENSLQFQIMEANFYAASVVRELGFDVLDVHYYTRLLGHRRRPDGVHYNRSVVRFLTNLVLTHIGHVWDIKLPGKVNHRDIEYIVQAKSGQVKPPASVKRKEAHSDPGTKEVQCEEISGSEAVKSGDDGNNNVDEVEERKLLQPKRKIKPSDGDNCESAPAQVQLLLDKAAADLLSDADLEPDEFDGEMENYFQALVGGITFEAENEGRVNIPPFLPSINTMNGGRDPSSVEFYEDDIFWDHPPSEEWNANLKDPRKTARQDGSNMSAVWAQSTPFNFNPTGTILPGGGSGSLGAFNMGNFPSFHGNSNNVSAGEVYQFNAMSKNNGGRRNLFPGNENNSLGSNMNAGVNGAFGGNGGFGNLNRNAFDGNLNAFGGNRTGFGGNRFGGNDGFGLIGGNSGFGGGGNNSVFGGSADGNFGGIVHQMRQQMMQNTLANVAAQMRTQQQQSGGPGRWV
ncbi:hypothetical protein WDU94_013600 [Cyamophila willieti]